MTSLIREAYIYTLSLFRWLPEAQTGDGFADLILAPLTYGMYPPIIIELEHKKTADAAIKQIKEKDYIDIFRQMKYRGEIIFVGINYKSGRKPSRSSGAFACKIISETL